jgi:hypothetical protein
MNRPEASIRWRDPLALAGWTALAILYRGYGFGVGDQNLYLPFVMKWVDPGLFPNDYLLSLGYARESVTWIALSWASRWVDLQLLAGLAYAVTSYLTLWAVLRLAQTWCDDRMAGWIAVFLWTPVYQLPGSGMATVDPYFTGRGLAYALCFWALTFVLRDRTAPAVLLLCGAALVHSVTVVPVAGAVALWYLFGRRWKAFSALAGSMMTTAFLLLAAASSAGGHDLWARYDEEWYAIALRGASCLFPNAWNTAIWGHLLLYAVLALSLLALGRVLRGTVPHLGLAAAMVLGTLVLWGISWAGVEGRVVLLVQLSLMRSCLLLILLLSLALAGWGARLLEQGGWPRVLCAAAVLSAWMTDQPLLQALALVVGAGAVALPWEGPLADRLKARGVLSHRLAILSIVAVAAGLYALHFYWGRALPWTTPGFWTLAKVGAMTVALGAGWAATRTWKKGWATGVMAVAFGLAVVIEPTTFAVQSLGRLPVAGQLFRWASTHTFAKRMGAPAPHVREGLARAVRALVPEGSSVIVPAGWDSFRVTALRSSFVTLEDMIPAEFSRTFAMEWRRRMESLYGPDFFPQVETLVGAPPLEPEAVLALAERFPALRLGYIVSTRSYPFPALAQEGGWVLYRIPESLGSAPSLEK